MFSSAASDHAAAATRTFPIKYAGLVPDISSDIDPSGRTDLLKILDKAKTAGHITSPAPQQAFADDATVAINCDAVIVKGYGDSEVLLVVPLHMLASVGFVKEEGLNIVPLKIGEIDGSSDIYDLAVMYTKSSDVAEDICNHLGSCFHQVYREAMSTPEHNESRGHFSGIQSGSSSSVSPMPDRTGLSQFEGIIRQSDGCPTISTSTSASSKNTVDLINEYITMLSACLTHEELNKFAVLMKRWRAKEMPILEFAQKLMELYGVERKHLLARMKSLLRGVSKDDLEALNNFLQANGVTENAADSSPLLTGDMSLTTTDSNSPVLDNISGCSGTWSSHGTSRRDPYSP